MSSSQRGSVLAPFVRHNPHQKEMRLKMKLKNKKVVYLLGGVLLTMVTASSVFAQEDAEGSKDHPLISRYPGSYIRHYDVKEFGEYALALGKLHKDGKLTKSQELEGKVTQITYDAPEGDVYVAVAVGCGERPDVIVQVDVIEIKPMETGLVTVNADALAKDITRTGHVAIYGIHFDTGKADLKHGSEPTLREIAKLLQQNPKLSLYVVGHTDNVGTLSANMELSQRRADAVVKDLVTKHRIDPKRLHSAGVGPLSSVASNSAKCESQVTGLVHQPRRAISLQ
ncbi:MAG: OmpA family protein [Ignavibacteria bacterium]|nr:OmpA family protein [Ignavibacteria bacterium]